QPNQSAKANQSDNFTRTSNSVASSAAALVGETAYTDTILYRQSGFLKNCHFSRAPFRKACRAVNLQPDLMTKRDDDAGSG
ncbi:hypothetical protein, partial [Rhizobium sp. CSW-27]|uniref:hypothetical protein n=1 Tax=Rhizobium sp. CSW-27 TaxID=2839985 RepID=UPI001C025734